MQKTGPQGPVSFLAAKLCGLRFVTWTGFEGASKNPEFAQMQGAEKILVPANLKVTLH